MTASTNSLVSLHLFSNFKIRFVQKIFFVIFLDRNFIMLWRGGPSLHHICPHASGGGTNEKILNFQEREIVLVDLEQVRGSLDRAASLGALPQDLNYPLPQLFLLLGHHFQTWIKQIKESWEGDLLGFNLVLSFVVMYILCTYFLLDDVTISQDFC